MKIPFSYIFRNLWTRKLTTILTAAGMGLVVFVFSAVLMLDAGLKKTMVGTGSLDNVLAIRTGSETEIQSGITRDQAGLLGAMPQVARSKSGDPMVSKESLVLISLTKSGQEKGSNVVARGVSPMGITLRPQVKLIEGRMFRPGSSELVVGRNINREFNGAEIGQSLRFAQRDWVIVGVFDGGGSAFDSEIWGDVEQLMQAFRRLNYSSVIMQLAQQDNFESLLKEIAAEVRLTLDVKREQIFYEDQSRALSTFISILGNVLTVIFSIGAIIGAAITMYSSVAMRTAEIGTLRALGFRRPSILVAFLGESLLLGLVGGLAGLFFASFLQAITISTLNFQSFSQLAFSFTLTPKIVVQTLVFSMFMGFVGGFLPAMRAARMKIVDSLRAA
ncbi:MAG: ABC transporter permease [Betaproteobacteria bacterium]|jgi:putative ABC transport system permease protein